MPCLAVIKGRKCTAASLSAESSLLQSPFPLQGMEEAQAILQRMGCGGDRPADEWERGIVRLAPEPQATDAAPPMMRRGSSSVSLQGPLPRPHLLTSHSAWLPGAEQNGSQLPHLSHRPASLKHSHGLPQGSAPLQQPANPFELRVTNPVFLQQEQQQRSGSPSWLVPQQVQCCSTEWATTAAIPSIERPNATVGHTAQRPNSMMAVTALSKGGHCWNVESDVPRGVVFCPQPL